MRGTLHSLTRAISAARSSANDAGSACSFEKLEPRILLSADLLGGAVATDLSHSPDNDFNDYQERQEDLDQLVAPFVSSLGREQSIDAPGSLPVSLDLASLGTYFDGDGEPGDNLESANAPVFADGLAALLSDAPADEGLRQEIIFIDAATPDYEQLVEGIATDSDQTRFLVFILDGQRDGVAQISDVLANYQGVDAIHLVSHGSEGQVNLGNGALNTTNVADYAAVLGGWQSALDDDADLLIYGCNLAGNAQGQDLLQVLAGLTGADIAASDDLTGNAALGADWDLEYQLGQIETDVAFNLQLQESWQNTLATFTVTTTADTIDATIGDGFALDAGGATSLRAAIMEANALPGDDQIDLPADTYTLVAGDLEITSNITLVGAGADTTVIDGGGTDRIFNIDQFSSLDASGLTLQGGVASGGGDPGKGGAIFVYSDGALTLNRVNITGNQAVDGGGIYNKSTLNLTDVTISGNTTSGGAASEGGGLFNAGSSTLTNVTLSGNSAGIGGGIHQDVSAFGLNLSNVTVSGNTATGAQGGGINTDSSFVTLTNVTVADNTAQTQGGGIYSGTAFNLSNTLIANNTSVGGTGHDVFGSFTSDGSNIVEDIAGSASFGADTTGVDPGLMALGDNGGFTQTHALQVSSIAIDSLTAVAGPGTDQRGVARDAALDLGAYEFVVPEYLDRFDSVSYTGSDGSVLWSTPWTEIGEADGSAAAGRVYVGPGVTGQSLLLEMSKGAQREVDLSGVLNATLSFDWARVSFDPGDTAILEISTDGIAWTLLETFDGSVVTDASSNFASHDISAHLDSDTLIRFTTSYGTGVPGFAIDNVAIDTSGPNPFGLVWVDQAAGKIQVADSDGSNVGDLITGLTSPLSVAVDMPAGKVYWSDDVLNIIQRANFDGTGVETIISSVPGTVSIELDLDNGKIYWVEGGGGQLLRANLDGTVIESLVGSPNSPSGIAIDVANDKVYWADPGVDRIKQTSLDGIGTSNLVTSGVGASADIALDLVAGQLYWSDATSGEIRRVNFDGSNITTVISGLSDPYGLSIDSAAGKIYWSDDGTNQIHRANLNGTGMEALVSGIVTPRDIDVMQAGGAAPEASLWLSTQDAATDDKAFVINSNDIVSFGDPDLRLELGDGSSGSPTDGTFATEATLPENVRAMHYVNSVTTVDTWIGGSPGTYDLQPGQIVVSMRAGDTLDFDVLTVGGGNITVNNNDVLVYTPGTGEYEFLLQDAILEPDTSLANIHAVSIVEQQTTIGVDTVLEAGTYLIARSDPAVHSDISTYDNTFGRRDLLLGPDFLSASDHIQGIELLESELTLGDTTLLEGTLLVSISQAMDVGSSGGSIVSAEAVDVVALTINATEQDSVTADTNVDAAIFFDGSDIGLSIGGGKEINGLTLAGNVLGNSAPTANATASDTGTEDTDQVYTHAQMLTLIGAADVDDVDAALSVAITNVNNGSVVLTGGSGGAGTTFTFTPTANFVGNLAFDYQVSDDEAPTPATSVVGTATVTLSADNDAPTVDVPVAIFINEIHYDNIGPDSGEAIEIAGVAGNDLNGWQLVMYSGFDGSVYDTVTLSGTIPNQADNFGTLAFNFPVNGIQNATTGNPDGIALVDPTGTVVQFLSYEGSFMALEGPANGMTSTDIGVAEDNATTAVGDSLQLTGPGPAFTWAAPAANTFGAINTAQDFAALAAATNQTVDEDTALVFNAANGNAIIVDDVDAAFGAALDPVSVQLDVSNGTLTLATTADLGTVLGDGTNSITFTGTIAELNTALDGLTYQGDPDFNGSDTLAVLVDDQANSGAGTNLLANGVVHITIDPANEAPVLDSTGAMSLLNVLQDNTNSIGDSVADIILSALSDRITDADASDPEGIAVIGVDNSNGRWEYSVDGGENWSSFVASGVANGATDDTAALLLDEAARIRFVPNASYAGPGGAISFHAWDQTSGSVGQAGVDVSTNGDATAFSTDVETASVNVSAAAGISNSVPGAQPGTEDTVLVFSVAGSNPVSVSDGSADDATLRVTLASSNGILTLAGTTGISILGGADGSASMTLIGLESAINTALDGLRFDPDTGYTGAANVQITTEHAANLEGHYSFDDPATPVTLGNNDAPDGGPNATITGATGVFDGTAGQVLGFDGNDTAQISGRFSDPADVTLAAWVNLNDGAGNAEAISIGDRVILRLDMSVSSLGVFGSFNNGSGYDVTSNGIFIEGTGWHHVAYTIDDANNAQNLYIDGQLVASTSYTGSIAYGGALGTTIGSHANASSYYMDGLIDDARIYSRALNAGEINALASGGLSETSNVAINIAAALNNDPTLDQPITDQVATEDALFSYQFAANVFGDADGDSLTFTSDASGWLAFDAATRTFSGTPLNADVGTTTVTVTADDSNGGTVSDTFDIVISNTNDVPTVDNAIADQVATEDTAFNYQFAANVFGDVDGDALTYTSDASGWLSFDAATRTFSGTPLDADVGTTTVTVTADDSNGGTVSDSFDIVISNTNDVPTIANAIPDQVATEDTAFSFQFPANTFTDVDGDTLTYTSNASGWVTFNAATRTFSGTPLNADVGTIMVTVTADDGNGSSVDETFAIVVANSNDDPTLDNAIGDQAATEDALFNFTFAANSFGDVDVADTLTYTAQLAGGGALPSWLGFDAATRTFSGTPLNGDVGTITVEITADDENGGTPATDTFDIVISNSNDAPTIANAIPDQVATEDTAFSFQFPATTFTDVDGDTLTYTSNASGWVTFNAATRTFSGTPLNADVGTIMVTVTADDGNGSSVDETFAIVVANSNDDPTLDNAIGDQAATEDALFNFTFAANSFGDVDVADTLTYTAQLAGGGALPSWLGFDAATRTFSGTPLNGDVGTITVDITADDGNGGTPATDTFDIVISNSNDVPTIANAIPDQVATEDTAFSFQFPATTFTDVDGDTLTYTSNASGWVTFNAATRTFSGTPLNADVGTIMVTVTADDGNGSSVDETFDIVVANSNDDPTLDNAIGDQAATEDALFNFTFAANSFGDVDVADTLTYTAQLAGGGALPSWLGFDAATRTFSGTPLNGDVGTITVDITADDGNGGTPATDTFDIVISNQNDAPTGPVVISSTLAENEVLTATVTLADEDGLGAFNYQWQRDGVDIAGATGTSYTLTDADTGTVITMVVSYTDARGTAESVTSNALYYGILPVDDNLPEPNTESPTKVVEIEEIAPLTDQPEAVVDPEPDISDIFETSTTDAAEPEVTVLDNDSDDTVQSLTGEIDRKDDTGDLLPELNDPLSEQPKPLVNLVTMQADFTLYNDPLVLVNFQGFSDGIDELRDEVADSRNANSAVVGSTFAVSAGLSAGYVAWLARSGAILSSVLSALPAWRFIDPLPVLTRSTDGSGDDESLQSLIDDSAVDNENETENEPEVDVQTDDQADNPDGRN